MLVLNANVRAFNSYAKSPKLHNLNFTAHPQRCFKPARRDKFMPDSRSLEGETGGVLLQVADTRILMRKVQMLTGAGIGVGILLHVYIQA